MPSVEAVLMVGVTIEPNPGGGPDQVTLNLVVTLTPEQMAELGVDYGETITPEPPAKVTVAFLAPTGVPTD